MAPSLISPDHSQPNARSSTAATPPVSRFQWLRPWLLMLACGLLGVNVIIGDRVSIYSPQVHQQTALDNERLEHEIRQLKLDNRRKRDEARRLREDPAAIEALARRELGMIRRGEIVFLLADEPGVRRPLSR